MGSGKSTVGPLLAIEMGWGFFDLDDKIESAIDMSIAAYFKEAGEPAFRAVERKELHKSVDEERCVIAVGGGALCNQENLDCAKKHGKVVFLQISVAALMDRLKAEQATRPMLLSKDGRLLDDETVKGRISQLLDSRLPFYEQADLVIQTDDMLPIDIAKQISAHFSKDSKNG